ncbi:hypothetical protein [Burkholderia sp. BCC0044]|uniref:hypothetical protein n=1 Tax=Burkholderia sp. BCC0044 TaxID=2676295 RepID=UPI001FC842ED|nr:hypothetical protein [Burkholderia sp. BCC0044]
MNWNIRFDFDTCRDRLRWAAYVTRRRLGAVGFAAAIVAAAVPIAHVRYFQPEADRLVEARADASRALSALAKQGSPRDTRGMTLRDVQKLRVAEQAYAVFELLERNGVERKHATYRHDVEVKGQLRRMTIDIAASGTYADLRAALRAISDQPMVRVESMTLARDNIDDVQLEIDVRVSILGPDA